MAIPEVFSNPTVKTVIFQIRFPNLFFIENIIGDYQVRIMNYFKDSALILSKEFNILVGPQNQPLPNLGEQKPANIWQFISPEKNVNLSVQTSSLDIVSTSHKSYAMGEGEKFRDIIELSLTPFFELVQIPIITRIGLRYIDNCPIIEKNNTSFSEYYNTAFPLDRFPIDTAENMDFRAIVKKGEYYLTYRETLKKIDGEFTLELDFDGFASNVKPNEYLSVTDELHTLISNEFEATANESLIKYMRQK